jgi:hypothetical protein
MLTYVKIITSLGMSFLKATGKSSSKCEREEEDTFVKLGVIPHIIYRYPHRYI